MNEKEFSQEMKTAKYIQANSPIHQYMSESSQRSMRITCELNGLYHTPEEVRLIFSRLTGKKVDDSFMLFPPFYSDYGQNITIGKNVFINSGCCFQDQGGIEIGDGAFIGQQVVIATLNHDPSPENRASMFPARVRIGKRVWIGAHATVCPGVTVGDNSIIGAGAVVTKDVPENCVVAGVPAKILRLIQ